MPTTSLTADAFTSHPWLLDLPSYQAHCAAEMALYEKIAALARQLSESREQAKASLLQQLVSRSDQPHNVALAFDSIVPSMPSGSLLKPNKLFRS